MVMGISIRMVIDYVSKKKGVEGLKKFLDEVNSKGVLYIKSSEIKNKENYPGYYLLRTLNATLKVLSEEQIKEMGEYFGENMNVSFRGLLGRVPPREAVQNIVIGMRRYLPIFHTGYRSKTKNTYWLVVSRVPKSLLPFIDGLMGKLFEKHGGVRDIKKLWGENKIEYTIKL